MLVNKSCDSIKMGPKKIIQFYAFIHSSVSYIAMFRAIKIYATGA